MQDILTVQHIFLLMATKAIHNMGYSVYFIFQFILSSPISQNRICLILSFPLCGEKVQYFIITCSNKYHLITESTLSCPDRKWVLFFSMHKSLGLSPGSQSGVRNWGLTMSTLLLVVGVVVGLAYIFHHVVVKGKRCTSKTKLHGKTVIVTGK